MVVMANSDDYITMLTALRVDSATSPQRHQDTKINTQV
jgi:hypothetical protein